MQEWRADSGDFDLAAVDPESTAGAPGDDKDVTKEAFKALRHELSDWQERLYAERRQALL
ncbi:MAG: polyphosphate kinase 2 family protein, partial [Actinobacteria bacterium]|nr:polyphosphate kinase 2 family protein [Actinomycetota bacterium]